MGFLAGKKILITGMMSNRSIAYGIAKAMHREGAVLAFTYQNERFEERIRKMAAEFDSELAFPLDVTDDAQIEGLFTALRQHWDGLDGLVHSIAFANYADGLQPFHCTGKRDFLQAMDISCFSLISLANHFRELLDQRASVVTVSISTTRMAAENYGYMAPVKAALESSLCFLAKSFSTFSEVRFNAVCPGLLKTSASAGIPGYVDSYLFAEQATLRKRAVQTDEAANVAAFLLSPRSSGMTGQCLVVDGGMGLNYFDQAIVSRVVG